MVVIDIKRIISRSLFVLELSICMWVYLFGMHGFYYLLALREECEHTRQKMIAKKEELQVVQEQIIAWNVHSFYKEKMAREQLQMAHKDEVIYYLS